jgi:RNA polymerase sigma-70 factor (ECF subfamily)
MPSDDADADTSAQGTPSEPQRVNALDPGELAAAAARWPEIRIDDALFRDYVSARVAPPEGYEPTAADTLRTPEQLASLYLCCACLQRDDAACAAFHRTYATVVRNAIARIHPDRHWLDDVASALFEKLLIGKEPRLARYSGRGDLGAWLKVAATRAAIDAKRRLPEQEDEPLSSGSAIAMSMSPESLVFCRTHATTILDALSRATSALDRKQRNVLRLSYDDGMSIDEIGALYGVHRATVARWLAHARSAVESAVFEDLKRRHGIEAAEVASLIQGARPHLEDNLRRLLAKPSADDRGTTDDVAPEF